MSTAEAEYIALSHAAKEALWMRKLLRSLRLRQEGPTDIKGDNTSSMIQSRNPADYPKMKHISIRFHFIQSHIGKRIELTHVPSKENVADIFTKPLPRSSFDRFRTDLGLQSCNFNS